MFCHQHKGDEIRLIGDLELDLKTVAQSIWLQVKYDVHYASSLHNLIYLFKYNYYL